MEFSYACFSKSHFLFILKSEKRKRRIRKYANTFINKKRKKSILKKKENKIH